MAAAGGGLTCDLTTSIPSVNFTPDNFGNWLYPSRRRQLFLGGLGELECHGERGLVREASLGAHGAVTHGRERAFDELVTGMRIPVPAHPAGAALVLAYGVTIRDEGHREHVSGQADPYDEP